MRINPEASASYLEYISYGGEKATKFGIYADRFEEALGVAESHGLQLTPLRLDSAIETRKVTIAGNINEGVDTLAEDIEMPVVKEGDMLALLNIGGYSVSCGSDHCMRGDFSEYLILD